MENQEKKLIEVPKQYVFFHVAGVVTFVDRVPGEGMPPEFKKETVTILYRGLDIGITGKEYGNIHSALINQFRKEYTPIFEVTKVEPNITKCDIITIFPLGQFTQEEFQAGIELDPMTTDPDKKS